MPTALLDCTAQAPPELSVTTPGSLAEAFAAVSVRRGESTAVRCGECEISYTALHAQANAVAHALRRRDIGRGSLVAIHLPRGIDMVIAMLGICKAGAAYVPLDPTYPEARILETLVDAQPALLITEAGLRVGLEDFGRPMLLIQQALSETGLADVTPDPELDDLAYVIYTSGSTGKPKGVMVSQRNVLRLFSQTAPWFDFDERDVWTMFHSFAFDFSVWEIWGALLSGGTLIVVPYETSRSPEAFYELLSRERVTVLNQTPTAFNLFASAVQAKSLPLSLRYVIFGGEALNLRSLQLWVQRFGDESPRLINMYGITETTVHVTYRRILRKDIEQETESLIGIAIPDLKLHLLDEQQRPVAAGEIGEMYIEGAGVALGYLHRPELTSKRFVSDLLGAGGSKLYRSGDLARIRHDGELVYLGRADRQVKINGFRVEPGEIEAAIAQFPGIQQVCVTPLPGAEGAQFLAAYVVMASAMDRQKLAAHVAQRLPAHMRPTFYRQMPSLPLTVNGKVDRDALPRPEVIQERSTGIESASPAEMIADLWATILQAATVSATDNFFDSGGTSLQLLALRSALQQRLQREIPVLWLLEHTSPKTLAEKLQHADVQPHAAPAFRSNAERQRQSFARARAARSLPE